MPTLPAASDLTGSTVTEAQYKAKLTDLITLLSDLLGTAGTTLAARQKLGTFLNSHSAKTSAYAVATSDQGDLIHATSGTWALTLPAVATAGAGFHFAIRNSGSGIITVTPQAAELVDGAATVDLRALEAGVLYCDGAAWRLFRFQSPTQSSLTDATANRLMLVGGFGLGAVIPTTLSAAGALDSLAETGFWRVQAADVATVNGPSGAGAGLVFHISYNSTFKVQTYFGFDGRSWRRAMSSSTWGAWAETYGAATAALLTVGSLGFATGAGGAVTQATSKTTSVTLNTNCGQITMNNAALAAGASAEFTVTNSTVGTTDVILANPQGHNGYRVEVRNVAAGSFGLRVTNVTGGSLSEALVINFAVLQGVIS